MYFSLPLLLAALSAVASASPKPAHITPRFCTADGPPVEHAASTLRSQSSGAAFCSSLLHITTETVVDTVSPAPTTSTVIAFSTTVAPVVTTTITSTAVACNLDAAPANSHSQVPGSFKAKRTAAKSPAETPVPAPSAVSSLDSQQRTEVCKCLAFPTSTVTSTTTVGTPSTSTVTVSTATTASTSTVTATVTTTTAGCAAPTPCNNQGLQYAVFYDIYNYGATYDPTYMKAPSAGGDGTGYLIYNDVTDTIGGFETSCPEPYISLYGSKKYSACDYFSLDHRGYIYAPNSGTYTIAFRNVDNVALFWTGDNAVSGWTRANADLVMQETNVHATGQATYNLQAGQYLPIRIAYGQYGGHASFHITVTDPNGVVYIDSWSNNSPYVVQYSCDQSAPPFPYAFGYEQ